MIRFIIIVGLLILQSARLLGGAADDLLSDDEFEALKREGVRQLSALIAQNEWNNKHGLAHLNRYIFSFNRKDKWLEERVVGSGVSLFGQGMEGEQNFESLAKILNTYNVLDIRIKLYVCVVSQWDIALRHKIDFTKVKNTKELEPFTQDDAAEAIGQRFHALIKAIFESALKDHSESSVLGVAKFRGVFNGNSGEQPDYGLVNGFYVSPKLEARGDLSPSLTPFSMSQFNTGLRRNVDTIIEVLNNAIMPEEPLPPGPGKDFYDKHIQSLKQSDKANLRKVALLYNEIGSLLLASYNDHASTLINAYYTRHYQGLGSEGWAPSWEVYIERLNEYTAWFRTIESDLKKIEEQDRMVLLLHGLSDKQLEAIAFEDRIRALKVIATDRMFGEWNFRGENEENLALRLIRTIPETEISPLFIRLVTEIVNNKVLLVRLDEEFNDTEVFIGDQNYGVFIGLLMDKFIHVFTADPEQVFGEVADNNNVFIWNEENGNGLYETSLSDYGFVTLKLYTDQVIKYGQGRAYAYRVLTEEKSIDAISPIAIVAQKAIPELGMAKYDFQVGPAILMHYLLNEKINKDVRILVQVMLDGIGIATGVGALSSGVRGVRLAIVIAELVVSMVDLTGATFEEKLVTEYGEDGKQALASWRKISFFVNIFTLSTEGFISVRKFVQSDITLLADIINKSADLKKFIFTSTSETALQIKALLIKAGVKLGTFAEEWHALSLVKLKGLGYQLNSVTEVLVVYASYGASYISKKLLGGEKLADLKKQATFQEFIDNLPTEFSSLKSKLIQQDYDDVVDIVALLKTNAKITDDAALAQLFDDLSNVMEPFYLKKFLDKGIDPYLLRNSFGELLVKAGEGRLSILKEVSDWDFNSIKQLANNINVISAHLKKNVNKIEDLLAGFNKASNKQEWLNNLKDGFYKNGYTIKYTNPSGNIIEWTNHHRNSVFQSIEKALISKDPGKFVEGKVGNFVKNQNKEIEGFGVKIENFTTKKRAGEIDVLTKNEIIEAKKNYSTFEADQFKKFTDSSLPNYINPNQRKIILYIDDPLTAAQKSDILSQLPREVTLVNSLNKLGDILK
jgi:hypothetical protein